MRWHHLQPKGANILGTKYMRILSVAKKWDKLKQPDWTTFRFTRKDRDWYVGEVVQVFYKSRSPQREMIGMAEIISKDRRKIRGATQGQYRQISNKEAVADGFKDWRDMWEWMLRAYGIRRLLLEPMNKLTLRWIT